MKISVNIKVRNPEWYWTKEELKESKNGHSMGRKEWEMINEGKISKHTDFVDFEFKFDVYSFSDNRDGIYSLRVLISDNENFENSIEKIVTIKDVTVVEFDGVNEKGHVVVSNDLIFQFIGAKKGNSGRYYWYFYLKENEPYEKLSENIWLSERELISLSKQLENTNPGYVFFKIDAEKNLILRSEGGLFPV